MFTGMVNHHNHNDDDDNDDNDDNDDDHHHHNHNDDNDDTPTKIVNQLIGLCHSGVMMFTRMVNHHW